MAVRVLRHRTGPAHEVLVPVLVPRAVENRRQQGRDGDPREEAAQTRQTGEKLLQKEDAGV